MKLVRFPALTLLGALLLVPMQFAFSADESPGSSRHDHSHDQRRHPRPHPNDPKSPNDPDVHSYARPDLARVTHVDLDLRVDFKARVLAGQATLQVQAAPKAREVVLDTKGLQIRAVRDSNGKPLQWSLGKADETLGAPLTVMLPKSGGIVVQYSTRPESQALQWLNPEQTEGREHPFLYSQGQTILTRTWVPTQDSPGIRQTWSARITTPKELRAVMSAQSLTPVGERTRSGECAWRFRMDKPVAPYLIAVAVGDLTFQPVGARTGVYAEPVTIAAAARQMANLEQIVSAAESFAGPYNFDRYDVLILPPSFPLAGMENTRLTFITPTVITGDHTHMWIVIHEFAHAWASELVSNVSWADMWLNEGITRYYEYLILEKVYGAEFKDILNLQNWNTLINFLPVLGGEQSEDTRLYVHLEGRNPDDAMTPVGTDKGAAFFQVVEKVVGRERLLAYLRDYFRRFAYQAHTTPQFVADLRKNLLRNDASLEQKIGIEEWVYGVGIPANAPKLESAVLEQINQRVQQYTADGANGSITAAEVDAWSTHERVYFLQRIPRALTVPQLEQLETVLGKTPRSNYDTDLAWLRLAVANRYTVAVPQLTEFLTRWGRRSGVVNLFRDLLAQGEWGRGIADAIYPQARPGYHPVTQLAVDELLGYSPQ